MAKLAKWNVAVALTCAVAFPLLSMNAYAGNRIDPALEYSKSGKLVLRQAIRATQKARQCRQVGSSCVQNSDCCSDDCVLDPDTYRSACQARGT